ncbi:hypothetical protein [Vibrio mimicus]|uniref:hypothetical protein n=1 Tax=Vibrio mimicus TaxID=674 RepID=UPI0011D613A3|nr:hypothetical protein [Vibrio mimicus]TXY07439.1 hypothetical protein FXE99_16665 [Vibrio mimicus]
MSKVFEFCESLEVARRQREIQILVNLIEPDPEYQPFYISDESTLFDFSSLEEQEIRYLLEQYFGKKLEISIGLPIWRFIDELKRLMPSWPE